MIDKKTELIRFRCTENLRNAVLLGCQRTGMNISEFIETAAELMVDYTIHNARPNEMRLINRYGADFARNELQIIMRPIAEDEYEASSKSGETTPPITEED